MESCTMVPESNLGQTMYNRVGISLRRPQKTTGLSCEGKASAAMVTQHGEDAGTMDSHQGKLLIWSSSGKREGQHVTELGRGEATQSSWSSESSIMSPRCWT